MNNPYALAVDSSGDLYVANYDNSTVEEFASGSTTPSATYSAGVSKPYALALDSSGNLYVANYGNNTVEEFASGSTTPSATYSAGVSKPDALALDSSGNLYVADGGTMAQWRSSRRAAPRPALPYSGMSGLRRPSLRLQRQFVRRQ